MKITALVVVNANARDEKPSILANASDLTQIGFFNRPIAAELIAFVSRTVANRTLPDQRLTVLHQGFKIHAYNSGGLCVLGFMDDEYPVRSSFLLLNKVLVEYRDNFGDTWKNVAIDSTQPWPFLNEALTKYQDQAEADQLFGLWDFDESVIILSFHSESRKWLAPTFVSWTQRIRTIDSMLGGGEKFDRLVEKSADLSATMRIFYNQPKKAVKALKGNVVRCIPNCRHRPLQP